MKPRCGDCRFWHDHEDEYISGQGSCRRHAPVMLSKGSSGWPYMPVTGWCGEFERGKNGEKADINKDN